MSTDRITPSKAPIPAVCAMALKGADISAVFKRVEVWETCRRVSLWFSLIQGGDVIGLVTYGCVFLEPHRCIHRDHFSDLQRFMKQIKSFEELANEGL